MMKMNYQTIMNSLYELYDPLKDIPEKDTINFVKTSDIKKFLLNKFSFYEIKNTKSEKSYLFNFISSRKWCSKMWDLRGVAESFFKYYASYEDPVGLKIYDDQKRFMWCLLGFLDVMISMDGMILIIRLSKDIDKKDLLDFMDKFYEQRKYLLEYISMMRKMEEDSSEHRNTDTSGQVPTPLVSTTDS